MTIFKWIYFLNALIITTMIVYGKLFVFRKKEAQFVSDYCATIAGLFGLYALLSLGFVWVFPSTLSKVIMLCFAVSPFALGVVTNYHTEKYFSVVQVALLILSAAYVVL